MTYLITIKTLRSTTSLYCAVIPNKTGLEFKKNKNPDNLITKTNNRGRCYNYRLLKNHLKLDQITKISEFLSNHEARKTNKLILKALIQNQKEQTQSKSQKEEWKTKIDKVKTKRALRENLAKLLSNIPMKLTVLECFKNAQKGIRSGSCK